MDQLPSNSPFVPLPVELLDARWQWLVLGVTAAIGILCIGFAYFLWQRIRTIQPPPIAPPVDLSIDVTRLPITELSSSPKLEVYGTPVRLAVVVLAPVGRDGVLPQPDELLPTIEQIVPGMSAAMTSDRPLIRGWPGQLSSQGFAQAFFNNVPLPGDRGKGSPWCSLVGKFSAGGKLYLAGIVFRAATDNPLSHYVIQHEGQWNDVLRRRK